MKKILVIFLCFLCNINAIRGQEITSIEAKDWSKLQKSGFFSILAREQSNAPIINNRWWWAINSSFVNNEDRLFYNAQLAFEYATYPVQMYVRITDAQGKGDWAKVLHSKGNHAIDGKLTAKEIEIKVNTGADFVFKPDYNLRPLSEVKSFVETNQHLPEIPSEKEMIENGVSVNEMQIKLLQKIEELTLYVIEQNQQLTNQQQQISQLKDELDNLKNK